MSEIVIGIGASHSTLMNTHWHEVAGLDRAEAFRAGLEAAAAVLAAARPDVVVVIGSNHFRGVFLDMMPTFAVGVGEVVGAGEADTPSGQLSVHPPFARHLCESLVADGFDPAFSLRLQVDHGITHSLQYLTPKLDVPVVPVIINVFAPPLPAAARCRSLGQAIRRAVAGHDDTLRVAVVASGGLSHQLPFPDWSAPQNDDDRYLVEAWLNGRTSWRDFEARRREIVRAAPSMVVDDFDHAFLASLEAGTLAEWSELRSDEIARRGGNGAQEIRTWLAMAAALDDRPGRALVYAPMPEWLTGMAVAVVPGKHPSPETEHQP